MPIWPATPGFRTVRRYGPSVASVDISYAGSAHHRLAKMSRGEWFRWLRAMEAAAGLREHGGSCCTSTTPSRRVHGPGSLRREDLAPAAEGVR
ncbi:hypothetical protein [Salinispora mooreana]|uniref:hypothetical protein n=1 Tax=Salinispora mooreana TaxID=999545 RepID=UPI0004B41BA8|nr:hypothetical protein [Salinispora mooreana]